LRIDEPVLIY